MNRHETISAGAEVLRYFRAMRRKLRYILLPVVLVPCAAITGLTLVAPVYESSSVVIYEEKLPFAREMGDMIVQKPTGSYEDAGRLVQIEARLKSGIFLGEVVQELKLRLPGNAPENLESAKAHGVSIEEYEKRLMVDALRRSIKIAEMGPNLYRITISDPDPERAFRLTDGVTGLFVEYVTKGQLADIRAAGTFSEDQLPVYEEKLRQSEEKLRQFRAQMATRAARDGVSGGNNVASARSVLEQTETEIAELEANRKTSKEAMDATYPNAVNPVTLIRSSGINSAYARLAKEEQADVPLLVQGVSRSSIMERVGLARERLLAAIEETVGNTLRGSPDGLLSLVSEQVYDDYVVRSLEKRRGLVSGFVGQYSRAAGRRPQDEMELARLGQEVEANNTVLQSLRRQLTSSQISEAAQTTRLGVRIEVIEPATRPFTQAGPGRDKILILAFLLGPFMGICYVVLSEYMDDSVKSVGDVTSALGIPVLGTIPKVPGATFWETTKARRWPYYVVLAALILTVGFKLAHEPLANLLGRGQQGLEVGISLEQTEGP
ncbi:MAG: hypothetical protein NTX17_00400 [Candidatus Eisenbacteria bacterium]|nr:hypothetical protein [Candidatus Eisenbacteria bacterium]